MNRSTSQILFFKLRKVGNSLTRFQSNKTFLDRCNDNFIITKGFIKDVKVTYEDTNLIKICQEKQNKASWEIQNEVSLWLGQKVKMIKQDFNRIKARMFQVAKDRAKWFLFNIRKEMDELAKKLEHVKNRKWEKIHEKGRKYNPDEQSDINLRVSNTRTSLPTKHRRNNKRKLKGSKRNKKKKRRRQQIINRKKMELKDLLREANNVEMPDDMFHPLDNTNYNWQEQEKEVCSLGLKFVPTIRRHNLANKYKDFLQFGRRLR